MLRLKLPPGVSLIQTMLWISGRERFLISLPMSRCSSRRNSPSTWSSVKLGGMQLAFRCFGKPCHSVQYISNFQRRILWAIYQSQFSEWVLLTISPPIFLNGYISAMWLRPIKIPTESITCHRCSHTMTGVPVLTIWGRHCLILPFKAGMILTVQKFSTNYLLPMKSEIPALPILYTFSIVRQSHFSSTYHISWINWDNLLFVEHADVSK